MVTLPVDQEKKRELENRIANARRNQDQAEAEVKRISADLVAVEADLNRLMGEKKVIDDRKDTVLQIQKRIEMSTLRLGW